MRRTPSQSATGRTFAQRVSAAVAIAAGAAIIAGATGCQSQRDVLAPAGPIEKQRFSATVFDPYGDVEGGPEIVGGRPREFAQPLSEGDRSRLFHKVWPFQ